MNPSELIASLRAESDELIKYQFSHTKEAMSCLQRLHDLSLEAADALQALERVPMMWIPITERRPEYDEPVWVAWGDRIGLHAYMITFDSDGWLWAEADSGDLCEWDTDECPDRWMPLPTLPESKG